MTAHHLAACGSRELGFAGVQIADGLAVTGYRSLNLTE
jgi:hypothetical protein